MSGHSKWATIKHKKGAADARKGALYTKVIKEITMAARNGGGNPDTNSALRTAMAKAKEANMPSDNVKNAIKRGTGELPGIVYETINYEAYGPAGVAIMVEALTDNKNRTTAELRNILSKKGGNMAGAGSVAWMFNKKGYIVVDKNTVKEDILMDAALDAGAEDIKTGESSFEVISSAQDFEKVKSALAEKGITYQSAEVTMLPTSTVKVAAGPDAKQLLSLIETLEDHDDVQDVYANFDIPDEVIEQLAASE
ncbi:MAG: transcriptional regulator [Omnitrophica WOR_2 bacterium GWB2_45_9]|nr:MAG: transcriptional regulator [Omnitrophica WOR_2 bacterium GWB2_45_9]OGX47372.1 MAG: transcriptional regulator [Omnitrophica WOR_2 bacterium RIFOXYA2_FULL_45_12]OGX53086.1 MAG: transcriptional regulator [Omnitrophica WOR_2 bacterium RIFOXYB2_FULL_45_11]OGX61017.1 MAG: transcriptional regulator [Omnitrophica WOR_2 bacterium RIFOXYC2_FULL_45_15]HBU08708.1 YebC/PmpR family DNA-binding transcriptional regulator [Candidatus Omnitrophota bacterium]